MTQTLDTDSPHRELAHRVSGGISITLYWCADDNSTSVEIHHAATGQTLHFIVPSIHALDAFHHPFVHLPPLVDELLVPTNG